MQGQDIIVIGAGLGGLGTAALLAQAGFRVRVVEKSAHVGGRGRSRIEQGFVHNLGAHALYRNGPADRVLRSVGVHAQGKRVANRGLYVVVGQQLTVLPSGLTSLLTSRATGARGKWQLLRQLLTASESKARSWRGRSVREWLDAEARDPRARALCEMFVRLTTYSHAPERLSAELAIRQLGRAVRHGVMYLDGGWQTLSDGLERRVRELGVVVELGGGVAQIEHDGRARAVLMRDGRRLTAAAVVAAVEPSVVHALLPGDAWSRRWADCAVPARAACLDLGVRELPHPERVNVQSADAPLYFGNHSATADLAPKGAHVLHLVRYLAPHEDGRDAEVELRAFLDRVQPGVYERALVRRFLPNLTVQNDIASSARAPGQHPEIAGLHLVGDWVQSGAMLLDGVLESASEASANIAAALAATPTVARSHQTRDAVSAA